MNCKIKMLWHKNKKSQVIVFIFIGIVTALTILLYFFLKYQLVEGTAELSSRKVSQDIKPVVVYVESCMKEGLKKSILLASLQGGFIDPSKTDYLPMGAIRIPLYYNEKLLVPEFSEIKKQMENNILKYTKDCVNRMTTLRNYYKIELNYDKAKVELKFGRHNVYLKFYLPTKITLIDKGKTKKVNTYAFDFDTDFYYFYEIAKEIARYEYQTKFLEKLTLEAIATHLPYRSYYFTFEPLRLKIEDAKELLFRVLFANFHYVQFNGYQNLLPPNYVTYYKNVFSVSLPIQDSDLKIILMPIRINLDAYEPEKRLQFLKYAPEAKDDYLFDVQPSIGGYYKPMNIKIANYRAYLPLIPLRIDDYKYFVAYNVIVRIMNPKTLEYFTFAMRVKLNTENAGINKLQQFTKVELSDEGKIIKDILTMSSYIQQRECRGNLRITLNAVDEYGYDLKTPAKFYYKCLDQVCYLGQEGVDWYGKALTAHVPECLNPMIVAVANGYESKLFIIEGMPKNETTYTIRLTKLFPITLMFKYYLPQAIVDMDLKSLRKNQSILFTLKTPQREIQREFNRTETNTTILINPHSKRFEVSVVYIEGNLSKGFYTNVFNHTFEGYEKNMIIPILSYDYFNSKLEELIKQKKEFKMPPVKIE